MKGKKNIGPIRPIGPMLPEGVTINRRAPEFTVLELPGLNYFCTVPTKLEHLLILQNAITALIAADANQKEQST